MKNGVVGTSMAHSPTVPTESQNGSRHGCRFAIMAFSCTTALVGNPVHFAAYAIFGFNIISCRRIALDGTVFIRIFTRN